MSKNALVPISDGCEEIEASCIIDVLRRADTDVTVASVGNLQITTSRWTTIPMAESLIDNIRNEKDISDAKLSYMNKIDEYLQQMRAFYEKAS